MNIASINILGCNFAAKPMFFELDIIEPPPVLMLAINPTEFSKTFTKRVTDSRNRPTTRDQGSYIQNFDIDELDVMNCSGQTAMFYSQNGLTVEKRKTSLGYRNLQSLLQIYRNNGRNYNTRPKNVSPLVTGGDGIIKSVGRVIVAYDDVIYRGAFDTFSVNETDTKPFNFEFNFQFTVSSTIDVKNP
ncbi:MAG: hypothetical protein Q7R33_01960 [Nitrosarchaeum sp.]|nr:hypothetical protein [Nitrosarchaeum sp.]